MRNSPRAKSGGHQCQVLGRSSPVGGSRDRRHGVVSWVDAGPVHTGVVIFVNFTMSQRALAARLQRRDAGPPVFDAAGTPSAALMEKAMSLGLVHLAVAEVEDAPRAALAGALAHLARSGHAEAVRAALAAAGDGDGGAASEAGAPAPAPAGPGVAARLRRLPPDVVACVRAFAEPPAREPLHARQRRDRAAAGARLEASRARDGAARAVRLGAQRRARHLLNIIRAGPLAAEDLAGDPEALRVTFPEVLTRDWHESLLYAAVDAGDVGNAEALLRAGASPHLGAHDRSHLHPFQIACERQRPACALLLLDFWGGRALDAYPEPDAAARPPELARHANAWRGDAPPRTPLHDAVVMDREGDALTVARRLLAMGSPPDVAEYGETRPLHLAASRGHARVASLLLRHGADPAAPGSQWKWCDERSVDVPDPGAVGTPLEAAEENGHIAAAAIRVGIDRRSTAGPGFLRTPLSRSNRTRFL